MSTGTRNRQSKQSTESRSSLSRDAETERGFICRTFYDRGGKTMSQLFMEAKAAGIDPSWFSDPASRVVWKAAEEIFKGTEFSKINLYLLTRTANRIASNSKDDEERDVTVAKEFFDQSEALVRGTDEYSTYVKLLRDAAIGRRTMEAMTNAAESLASGEDAQQVSSRLIVQAQMILKGAAPTSKVSIAELADEVIDGYIEAHRQIVELGNYEYTPGVQLPWRKLAWAMNGMISGVYILAARPGVGKTAMALNLSRFWSSIGLKVVFNSIDMDPKSYIRRQLVEMSRISQRKMQFAKSTNFEADIAKLKAEAEELKRLEASGNFSLFKEHDIETFKAYCSILKEQGQLDVLVIDYLQLMTFKGCMRMGTTQKTTFVSNLIHEMSVELGIPILCLSQLNRDNTKDGGREPELSDLRESGAIEQDATAVMLLYRDEALRKKWRETEPPVQYARNRVPSPALNSICPIWLKLAKAREGDEGVKIPFVAMQSKYAWYLGDYEAQGQDKFARVYDDWRHDPIEKVWEENGALIRMEDVRAIEQKNREIAAAQHQNYRPRTAEQTQPAHAPGYEGPEIETDTVDVETMMMQEGL